MKGLLIKHGHSYALMIDKVLVAFAHPEDFSNDNVIGKLSLNNCRSIEYNCDFDKLIEEEYDKFDLDAKIIYRRQILDSLAEIVEKTLSLVADKQFTSNDMTDAYMIGKSYGQQLDEDFENFERIEDYEEQEKSYFENFKSGLNQTWTVEIERDETFNYRGSDAEILGSYNKTINTNLYKLDNKGCLILKRYGNN